MILIKVNNENLEEFFNSINENKFYYIDNIIYLLEIDENYKNYENLLKKISLFKENIKIGILLSIKNLNVKLDLLQKILLKVSDLFNLLIVEGNFNKLNRFYSEIKVVDFILDPHNNKYRERYDFIHHLNSGLNQVLCNNMKKNNIGLIVDLSFLLNKNPYEIGKNYARIKQNIKLCHKKININFSFILNFKDIKDTNLLSYYDKLKNILYLFNISEKERKLNNKILIKVFEKNEFKKSDYYINDYIKVIKNGS